MYPLRGMWKIRMIQLTKTQLEVPNISGQSLYLNSSSIQWIPPPNLNLLLVEVLQVESYCPLIPSLFELGTIQVNKSMGDKLPGNQVPLHHLRKTHKGKRICCGQILWKIRHLQKRKLPKLQPPQWRNLQLGQSQRRSVWILWSYRYISTRLAVSRMNQSLPHWAHINQPFGCPARVQIGRPG